MNLHRMLREPTGAAEAWHGDVVATAKRDLARGETLDGEGGFTVYGTLMPSSDSLAIGGLPLGLAHRARLRRRVPAGAPLRWGDVAIDAKDPAVAFRREMERVFSGRGERALAGRGERAEAPPGGRGLSRRR